MSKAQEPEYRDAYRSLGKEICPETGADLSTWSADSVRAHAENLFPDYARENFSDEARDRKSQLLAIAAAKEGK